MENPPNFIETDPTNTVSINVPGKEIEKQSSTSEDLNVSTYSLKQNYPNPFNPTTTFSYSIAKNGFVQLKVYDVLGNELALLVNEIKEPGSYKITYVASNLSSGIYFYILTAGNFTSTKKLILLK